MASNQAVAGPLTVADFNDPTSVMWAVLAFYGLEQYGMYNHWYDDDFVGHFENALRYFVSFYIPPCIPDECDVIAIQSISRNLEHDGENLPRTGGCNLDVQLFCRLVENFELRFSRNTSTVDDTKTRLTNLMRDLLHCSMETSLRSINQHQHDETVHPMSTLIRLTTTICRVIEAYLMRRLNMAEFDGHTPHDNAARTLVVALHDPLQNWVHEKVHKFVEDTRLATGEEIVADIEIALNELYADVAEFFVARSPLLAEYWDGYIDNYGDPDIIIFDDAEMDFEDVLTGPEHADINDVSIAFEYVEYEPGQSSCSLCGDEDVPMRMLWGCLHELCEECLRTQLNTNHACRYKCAFCRNEFFPRTD
jgi:hypothetical protein